MKYLKYFESLDNDLDSICKEYNITNYTINPDGSIDVDGNVDLYGRRLTKLPIKFGKVSGIFNCSYNNLTSLEFCPTHVGGGVSCSYNNLTSLEFCPSHVGGDFYCYFNQLTSLEGCPSHVGGDFSCDSNPVYEIFKIFHDYSKIELFNYYDIIRGNSNNPEIVLDRLNEFLEVIGKPTVAGVDGYKNI